MHTFILCSWVALLLFLLKVLSDGFIDFIDTIDLNGLNTVVDKPERVRKDMEGEGVSRQPDYLVEQGPTTAPA